MKGLKNFFSLVVVIFCCLAFLVGCWDGDGNNSTDNTIPKGMAALDIRFSLPKSSSDQEMRARGALPFEFTKVKITIIGDDMDPIIENLEIDENNGLPVAYGKILIPSSSEFQRCASVRAISNYSSIVFKSRESKCFFAYSQQIVHIAFLMEQEKTNSEPAIIEPSFCYIFEVPSLFLTIQEAINVANPNDVVLVTGGAYVENIILRDGVKLRAVKGSGATIRSDTDSGTVVRGAVGVSIEGFTIIGNGWCSGIMVFPGMTVNDNIIMNISDSGIIMDNYPGRPASIHHNVIIGSSSFGKGIYFLTNKDGCSVEIYNNTFLKNMRSISFEAYYYGMVSTQKPICRFYNNISSGDYRVIFIDKYVQVNELVDIEINSNIYFNYGTYSSDIDYGPFMQSWIDENDGSYHETTFTVDISNIEIDPKLDADYAPTNQAICGIGEGGVTPGARECVAVNGKLEFASSSSSLYPLPSQVIMGTESEFELGTLTAAYEGVNVGNFYIPIKAGLVTVPDGYIWGGIKSLEVHIGEQIFYPVWNYYVNNEPLAHAIFESDAVIEKNSKTSVKVKIRWGEYGSGAFSGCSFQIGRIGILFAIGIDSGRDIWDEVEYSGAEFLSPITIYRTKPTVSWGLETPCGPAVGMEGQVVAEVVIANPHNPWNYDLLVKSFVPSFSGTWIAGGKRRLRIYKDQISAITLLYTGEWDPVTDLEIADEEFTDAIIAAGGVKKLIYTLDTQGIWNGDSANKTTLAVSFKADALLWSDGAPNQEEGIRGAEGLPLPSKVLQYN